MELCEIKFIFTLLYIIYLSKTCQDIVRRYINFGLQIKKKKVFCCALGLALFLQQFFFSVSIITYLKNSKPASKMIVFFSTQDSVEFHSKLFSQVLLNTKKLKKTSDLLAESDDVESGYEETDDGRNEVKNSARSSEFKIYRLHGEMLQKVLFVL